MSCGKCDLKKIMERYAKKKAEKETAAKNEKIVIDPVIEEVDNAVPEENRE